MSSEQSRELWVECAKMAEQAERYDDMAKVRSTENISRPHPAQIMNSAATHVHRGVLF